MSKINCCQKKVSVTKYIHVVPKNSKFTLKWQTKLQSMYNFFLRQLNNNIIDSDRTALSHFTVIYTLDEQMELFTNFNC